MCVLMVEALRTRGEADVPHASTMQQASAAGRILQS